MKASDCPGFSRQRLIVLDKSTVNARLRIAPCIKGFDEISTCVVKFFRAKQYYTFKFQ